MQIRHKNRELYFKELETTSENFILPYIKSIKNIHIGSQVLEVGCGEGGNLLPFAKMGCDVVGVDLSISKIEDACAFFQKERVDATFIASDIFLLEHLFGTFDIIICHDVVEHIEDKAGFIRKLCDFLVPDGVIFTAFPAWQMPFGGHQQICRSKILSHLPYFHLLPTPIYKKILSIFNEPLDCIEELLSIKRTKCPIEYFERIIGNSNLKTIKRQFYLINPHYKIKFGLPPVRLPLLISKIPYLRNYFTTSAFYILSFDT